MSTPSASSIPKSMKRFREPDTPTEGTEYDQRNTYETTDVLFIWANDVGKTTNNPFRNHHIEECVWNTLITFRLTSGIKSTARTSPGILSWLFNGCFRFSMLNRVSGG